MKHNNPDSPSSRSRSACVSPADSAPQGPGVINAPRRNHSQTTPRHPVYIEGYQGKFRAAGDERRHPATFVDAPDAMATVMDVSKAQELGDATDESVCLWQDVAALASPRATHHTPACRQRGWRPAGVSAPAGTDASLTARNILSPGSGARSRVDRHAARGRQDERRLRAVFPDGGAARHRC